MPTPPLSPFRPWPKSIRKPLQPKNQSSNNPTINTPFTDICNRESSPRPYNFFCSITKSQLPLLNPKLDPSNKENFSTNMSSTLFPGARSDVKIIDIEPFEGSLAEELSSIRKKMERLKVDKDETEKLLQERDLMLDFQMNQLRIKGEAQKELEIQVDRLFRLKELRLSCLKSFPIRPLREKEQGKNMNLEEDQEKKLSIDETERDTTTLRN